MSCRKDLQNVINTMPICRSSFSKENSGEIYYLQQKWNSNYQYNDSLYLVSEIDLKFDTSRLILILWISIENEILQSPTILV